MRATIKSFFMLAILFLPFMAIISFPLYLIAKKWVFENTQN
jgi:hypothetical protein